MPIKKSSLERKWYYRTAKIFFLILPLLAIIFLFVRGYVSIPDLSQKGIVNFLQKNNVYIGYAVGGVIAYFLLLKAIWRGFLYIAFGGLEDDMAGKVGKRNQSVSSPGTSALTPSDKNQIIGWILMLILLACVYYAYFIYKSPQPISNGSSVKENSTCIPTGCGTQWRCIGSYYPSEVKKSVDGCFSSGSRPSVLYSTWSGTCRQCP